MKLAEVEGSTNKSSNFQIFTASFVVKVLRCNLLVIRKLTFSYLEHNVYLSIISPFNELVLKNTACFNGTGLLCANLMQMLYINHVLKLDPPNQSLMFTLSSLTQSLAFKQCSRTSSVLNSVGCEISI